MRRLNGHAVFSLFLFIILVFNVVIIQSQNENKATAYYRENLRLRVYNEKTEKTQFGNLLFGREDNLYATSTCGLRGKSKYCVLSELKENKKCFWCETNDRNTQKFVNHNITKVIHKHVPRPSRGDSWWQSENGVENVTIGVNFDTEFVLTHVVLRFKTFRPAAMLIERSLDKGKTWKVYRYFAKDCRDIYPGVPEHQPRYASEVVCESRYSSIDPSYGGEVLFRVLPSTIKVDNPHQSDLRELTHITNLRINFTRLHTLGDDLLDDREDIKEKYYYAIHELVVSGTCACNGHSLSCEPGPNENPDVVVHGMCKCLHNTKGEHCQECEDLYNDMEWSPGFGNQMNACRRCNCNNHATSCHFDRDIFEGSGKISGGVCDNCQHNTRGINCQLCEPKHYHIPGRDIQDPETCQPCGCYQEGIVDNGDCDSSADDANNIESGQCHCKANVEGRRCDRCKNGFWNFTSENPEGCQKCSCFERGTDGSYGCNPGTGECNCKRFVTGRDCNQCLPGYFGLSEKPDGCEPCNCDIGGAIDGSCDVIDGQCKCRVHMSGQRCDKPEQHYYVSSLDFLKREGELAHSSENCRIIIREPGDGSPQASGTGGIKVSETSNVKFIIDNVPQSMEYDIVVDYESTLPRTWVDARLFIQRPDNVEPDGPCSTYDPSTDLKQVTYPPGDGVVTTSPPSCLEANKTYTVILEFGTYGADPSVQSPSMFIDAVRVIPRASSVPDIFSGSQVAEARLRDYQMRNCSAYLYAKRKNVPVPVECEAYDRSISSWLNNGASSCQCNVTGSLSKICADYGGQCPCKKFIVGHKCDRCVPGTYGFGPDGCKPCDCSGTGAWDNFCDVETGQCKCRPNTYGRQCDECQPSYWNFPNCQRCECNGHADVCDSRTGACTSCRDATIGHNCEQCVDGYYGDPRIGYDIPCRPCPCPESTQSGHSFADRCALDPVTKNVICECREGYAGYLCDTCAENWYGNPEEFGGRCDKCECSNNIDEYAPGNCDQRTGACLRCLYNTTGDHCDVCKPGWFGDAIDRTCQECKCEILGTNYTQGQCDSTTGQCPCFGNVKGLQCNQCEENHWKLASGEGCEPCSCDPTGSLSEQCNLYDGQCLCKEGFGGRQCDQCQSNFWGNPARECYACECDLSGSNTMQCNRNNGTCVCKNGIAGDKCNECARGFLGLAPSCSPCGECYTNWDDTLNAKQLETDDLIREAGKIKQIGAAGAYTYQFDNMEKNVQDIKNVLDNAKISGANLNHTEAKLDELRRKLNQTKAFVMEVEGQLDNSTKRIDFIRVTLEKLERQNNDLKKNADNLKNDATALQEANVEGALRLMQRYRTQMDDFNRSVDSAKELIDFADRQCNAAENIVSRAIQEEKYKLNDKQLDNIRNDVRILRSNISVLNEHICDKRGDPCDSLCGGAGCDFCGGVSCDEGAIVKIEKALQLAQEASSQIRSNEIKAEELLRNLSQINTDTREAHNKVMLAYEKALDANYTTKANLDRIQNTISRIKKELKMQVAPKNIIDIAEKTLKMQIDASPDEINDYNKKIKEKLASLSNIREILAQTSNDSQLANVIKDEADRLKNDANEALELANRVSETIAAAHEAQQLALAAIDHAGSNITEAEKCLQTVDDLGKKAQATATETSAEVLEFQKRLKTLQNSLLKNTRSANDVQRAANEAEKEANDARAQASTLQAKYDSANAKLMEKADHSNKIKNRAHDLYNKSTDLRVNMIQKFDLLRGANSDSTLKEQNLKQLSDKLNSMMRQMEGYLGHIRLRSSEYRSCNT